MINQELLDILACPKCKGELKYIINEGNRTKGKLNCYKCKVFYKIEDDIPVMLIDSAEKLKEEDV